MSQRIWTAGFILLLIGATALLVYALFPNWALDGASVLPLVVFTAFMIGVEFFEVRSAGGFRLVPSGALLLALWILFGPIFAMLMGTTAILVGEGFIKRRPVMRVTFNGASTALSAGFAGWVYHALPFSGDLASPFFLLPAMASHIVFSATNMGLLAVVISLSESRRIAEVLQPIFSWHFLSGVVAAPLSSFLIFSYNQAGLWPLVLFGIPLFIVYQTHRLFEEMKSAHKETVAALTTALEADEPYTHGHSYRVAQYAVAIGRRMGLSGRELENLEYAGLLHDIGKIAITNDIVCKPARLTKEEFDILSAHPAIGGEIVEQMKFLKDAAQLVRSHHERPDGQGYPDGLKGAEIGIGSHILNLCDAVDAMCSNRPYRAALSLEQCIEEVRRFRGTQFDVNVVDAFEKMIAEGAFHIISQTDGAALTIQRIIRDAAAQSTERVSRTEAA